MTKTVLSCAQIGTVKQDLYALCQKQTSIQNTIKSDNLPLSICMQFSMYQNRSRWHYPYLEKFVDYYQKYISLLI